MRQREIFSRLILIDVRWILFATFFINSYHTASFYWSIIYIIIYLATYNYYIIVFISFIY